MWMGRVKQGKIVCLKCDKEKASNKFYINTSPLLSEDLSVFPTCKNCISEYINPSNKDEQYLIRVIHVLTILNKPFIKELWNSSNEEWSSYIPQVSSLNQYKGLSFKDGDLLKLNQMISSSSDPLEQEVEFSNEEMEYLIDFWGRGFTKEELEFLQKEFEKLINSYECESYAMEMLFQEASHQRLAIKKKRERNDSVDKELKTLQDLLGSANVKPMQESGANAAEQATFGTLIKKYENEEPIPEPEDEWKDVDGVQKYFRVWFMGHLCKMLGIKNEYTEEYEKEIEQYTVDPPESEEDGH
jgi:hypothetical protein